MRAPERILAAENSPPGFAWVKKSQFNAAKIFSHRQPYAQLLLPNDIRTGTFIAALLMIVKDLKPTSYPSKRQWIEVDSYSGILHSN